MLPEMDKERVLPVPLQTYRYSSEILSLSLGQGTSEITPEPAVQLTQSLDRLDASPNDKWMWNALPHITPEDLPQLVERARQKPSSAVLHVLIPYLGQDQYREVTEAVTSLERTEAVRLLDSIPTLDSRVPIMNPTHLQIEGAWNRIRKQSREQLIPVAGMKNLRLPIPQELLPDEQTRPTVSLQAIKQVCGEESANDNNASSHDAGTSLREVELDKTVAWVTENPVLDAIVKDQTLVGRRFCGAYAIAVPWSVDWNVDLDRANYRMVGMTGASGKGLTYEATTASGFMELAERVSATAGATANWPNGYKFIDRLVRSSRSGLQSGEMPVVNPNDFIPPVPYQDQEIYWIQGQILPPVHKGEPHGIWIPAQKAFHFTNLDEPEVLKDTSNGLAAGNTPEEARLHALLEIIERDGCYTTFTSPQRLFTLPPDGGNQIGQIIASYHERGLSPAFVDLTTDFGVPTYKAYIQFPDGHILSGSGAHLNGRIALNRAICELGAKCLGVALHGVGLASKDQLVQERELSDIPNLSSGEVKTDLGFVETVFRLNGHPVIYADLTRTDVDIPVVRAMVPGLDCPFTLTRREVKHFMEDYQGNSI